MPESVKVAHRRHSAARRGRRTLLLLLSPALPMTQAKHALVMFAFSMLPYTLVAWGYAELTDGRSTSFWTALGVLVGVRLFFSIIEGLGKILLWRLYGRKHVVGIAMNLFKANGFPQRKYEHDTLLAYLSRIKGDPENPSRLRQSAVQVEQTLVIMEELGILVGARMHSAYEAAWTFTHQGSQRRIVFETGRLQS